MVNLYKIICDIKGTKYTKITHSDVPGGFKSKLDTALTCWCRCKGIFPKSKSLFFHFWDLGVYLESVFDLDFGLTICI